MLALLLCRTYIFSFLCVRQRKQEKVICQFIKKHVKGRSFEYLKQYSALEKVMGLFIIDQWTQLSLLEVSC